MLESQLEEDGAVGLFEHVTVMHSKLMLVGAELQLGRLHLHPYLLQSLPHWSDQVLHAVAYHRVTFAAQFADWDDILQGLPHQAARVFWVYFHYHAFQFRGYIKTKSLSGRFLN